MAGSEVTDHDDDPDSALVRRAGAGDQAACSALVDRHLGRVLALAGRVLGNRADAEEVAQETFLRLWARAADWQDGGARVPTWLHGVALNLCRDRLRRRREAPMDDAGEPVSPDPQPDASLQRQDVAARVAQALARLPERQREAIVLCHYGELGNAEAAALLGLSVEALESLLARGRRRLREILRDEAPDLIGDLR